MSRQQLIPFAFHKVTINIISMRDNIFILKLITAAGILYKILFNYTLNLLNLQKSLILKNLINNKNLANIYLSLLIKNEYTLLHYKRYYLKLKGLGFSFKYFTIPQHSLLFNVGFSKLRFIQIPKAISIIKKPRKKKYIFVLLSTNFSVLLEFITLIRKLKTPDPYKIKGFRYIQELIKVKTGKKKK